MARKTEVCARCRDNIRQAARVIEERDRLEAENFRLRTVIEGMKCLSEAKDRRQAMRIRRCI